MRFDSALAPDASAQDKQDKWLLSSAGDHSLLTLPNANRALFFYRKASERWGPFVLDSVARQLNLFRQLGVMQGKVEEALASLPPAAAATGTPQIERVILFTGHRIDSAKRETPRFPASKEPQAKEAIRQALLDQKAITQGSLFGVAGGANGGDILFLELCDELVHSH